ncbi:ABC-type transport auxiliary lipoprotein family protein [Pseudomonas oleovorans]|uniref:ABC-type transport auxiliary lipoprotein family protein n=1 Tax=Ectopseudomonas oleovorans TaxID=301 RepID=A0AB35KW77_ECTOL|nr:ABC-type transport auxiliary lipoprotein family protein [Pseudomonas oleovorans]MCR1825342.1 ABC-type transport auxiliary lipoprotein family protein [Pseudomonas oleovorans]MDH0566247.1 ABC-type transport auxiliary lipoprotein family protein [Pseudomonas oleovorans]
MMTVVRPVALLLTTLLVLSGCSLLQQKPVPLYQLDSGQAVTPTQDNGVTVLVGPISVADYLRQQNLLQRQADGSLVAAQDARWASGLANDIDQQLLRQLAWRLNSQRLALAPAAPGFSADAQVMLSITRLDSGPTQPAVLEAQWRLLDRRGQLRDSRLIRLEEAHGGPMAEQVKAQSVLLQRLAAELAVAIQPIAAAEPTPEPPRKKPPVAKAKPQDPAAAGPKIPVAEPIKIDTEVFRF